MATALREWNEAQADAAEFLDLGADVPVSAEWAGLPPVRYVIREIDFRIAPEDNSLQFFFVNPQPPQPLPIGGIDAVTAGILSPPAVGGGGEAEGDPAAPATPLDVELRDSSCYIIYRLAKARNMRFAPTAKAMTHKSGTIEGRYGFLRHVNGDGASIEPLDDSKLIYIAAEPPAGVPPREYADQFNFKLRLSQHRATANSPPRILDLVLDPDIRYPGQ